MHALKGSGAAMWGPKAKSLHDCVLMMVRDVCRLSGEAQAWRRRGALEALGPLIRLLGGKAFSRSGIHQPLLNEASLHGWPFLHVSLSHLPPSFIVK